MSRGSVSHILNRAADLLDPTRPWQRRWEATLEAIRKQAPIITEEEREVALGKLEQSGDSQMEKWVRSVRERFQ